ncbi:MAG: IS4 family transposase [Alphaproteobacteria bacterium]|nr:MAG: IS4 family transposase [Alphaproteobacteria bacterium]
MRHHNSVFHQLLKHLPWDDFDRLARAHRADARARRLTSKSQFLAMLYGQLAGAASLREIVSGIESHAARLYHLGAQLPRRSTLADANHDRPSALFTELLALLMARAHRGLRRRLAETTYLIDATGLRLDARSLHWARFSEGVCGAKLHVVYDPAADRPIYAAITAARVNDITAAQAMPIEPGATYVFDLGYYDYAWWAKLDAAQCRIVTRLKSNTPLAVVEALPVPAGTAILSDAIGHLPARQGSGRTNPFQDPVREVRIKLDSGKVLRILSNDLDAPAQEIADLYKRRWAMSRPCRFPRGRRSCPMRSATCRHGRAAAEPTRFRIRCARFASSSTAARCCASCRMISTPRLRKSPISTNAAGRSNCSSAGSSKPSRSAAFSAPAKTPCASRSPSR